MDLAPVVLFVFNRPEHSKRTLQSLALNKIAEQSVLYIYSDGPRENESFEGFAKICEVRKVIREKKWCGQVHLIESDINKGLAASIISGVGELLKRFENVIVLEDDLIVSENFLAFMNLALTLYKQNKEVMHISGHSFPIFNKCNGIYFLRYVSPWGWATWADRWVYFEDNAENLYKKLLSKKTNWTDFNSGYGNEFRIQLLSNISKVQNTWAVKWHASVYVNNGLVLFPKFSLVRNTGFDGMGTHNNSISEILLNQPIAISNDFKYIKPFFNRYAFFRFHFFYLKNVKYPSLIKKFTKYLRWATLTNLSGSGKIRK